MTDVGMARRDWDRIEAFMLAPAGNEGVRRLAFWLGDGPAHVRFKRNRVGVLRHRIGLIATDRLLDGELVPAADSWLSAEIADLTKGEVLPEHFEQSYADIVAAAPEDDAGDLMRGKAEAEAVAADAAPVDDAPCAPAIKPHYCHGALGSVPAGPLFHALVDKRHGGPIVLTGMGLALRLTVAAALAMRASLDAGIAAAEGGR